MTARRAPLLLVAVLVAGCSLDYGDDDDSAGGGEAPRITSSFPGASVQELVRGGSIQFTARGEDSDSLELDWQFDVDGTFVAGGDSLDGAFDASWTMEHEEVWAGQSVTVTFFVTDGGLDTERTWPVDVAE